MNCARCQAEVEIGEWGAFCTGCGLAPIECTCEIVDALFDGTCEIADDALFDADELGLDPEEDDERRYPGLTIRR